MSDLSTISPQDIYDELNKRGAFQSDPVSAQIGHILRARGVVSDPTQGGLVAPPAAQAAPNVPNVAGNAPQMSQSGTLPATPNYLAPRDPAFEARVARYRQFWGGSPDDGSVPANLLKSMTNVPATQRAALLPAGLSDVVKAAILRRAYEMQGAGSPTLPAAHPPIQATPFPVPSSGANLPATIRPPAPAKQPNVVQRAADAVGNVLSTPMSYVKAAVQPVINQGYANAPGVDTRSSADKAEMQATANLPLSQRAKVLQGQDLRALGQSDKAQQLQAQYNRETPGGKLLSSAGGLAANMAVDPLTIATMGAGGLLSRAPSLVSKALTGGFVTAQAAPYLADPSKILADPAGFAVQLPLMAAGLAHLATPEAIHPDVLQQYNEVGGVRVPTVEQAQKLQGKLLKANADEPTITKLNDGSYALMNTKAIADRIDAQKAQTLAQPDTSNASAVPSPRVPLAKLPRQQRPQQGQAPQADTAQVSREIEPNAQVNAQPAAQVSPSIAAEATPSKPIAAPSNATEATPSNTASRTEGTAYTSDNTPVKFRYQVAEGKDLIASHTDTMQPNPAFDPSLQPRDRSRVASEAQVSDIATRLNPARLAQSASTSDGAPIVGPDMQVESGNGRTLGILRAYDRNLPGAAAYKEFLKANAQEYGIDPASVEKMQNPVLVRVRTTDMTPEQRAQFASEGGKSGVSGMSETETAQADAQKLLQSGLIRQFVPNETGNVASGANTGFVRSFLGLLDPAERNALIQGDGSLSVAGTRRVRNGILASAFEDGHALERMLESPDDNTRGVGNAMLQVAPKMAALKQAAGEGSRFPLDITRDVTDAANTLSNLREKGQSVETHQAQTGMFGSEMTPVGAELLSLMDRYKRAPAKLGSILNRYTELAETAGDPRQQSMFDSEPPTPLQSLHRAMRLEGDEKPYVTPANESQFAERSPESATSAPSNAVGRSAGQHDFSAGDNLRPELTDTAASLGAETRPSAGGGEVGRTGPAGPGRVERSGTVEAKPEQSAPVQHALIPDEAVPASPASSGGREAVSRPDVSTGAKNARTETERFERGQAPVERQAYVGGKEGFEAGKAAIEQGHIDPAKLAQEVAEKPRPLNTVETNALLVDRDALTRKYDAQSKALDEAIASKNAAGIHKYREQVRVLSEALDKNEQAFVRGGREQSAAFAARKNVVMNDGSLGDVLARARRMKGEELSPQETAQYKDLAQRYSKAQEVITAHEATIQKFQETQQRNSPREATNPNTREYGKANRLFTAEKAQAAQQRIAEKLKNIGVGADVGGAKAVYDLAKILPDLVEVGGYHFEALARTGAQTFTNWAQKMRADTGDKVTDTDLKTVYRTVQREAASRRQLTDTQKIDRANKETARLQDQLKTGTYPEPLPKQSLSPEVSQAYKDRALAKAQIRAAIEGQVPKPPLQKLADASRAFKLTGTTIFAKLAGATVVGAPLESFADLMSVPIGKMTVKGVRLADVADREGQFNLKAQGKGYRAMASRQAVENAKQTILTGLDAIDALAHDDKPTLHNTGKPTLLDVPGRGHGAMKVFLKTGEFTKSLQMRLDRAAQKGLDVSDPEVQIKAMNGAAVDAVNLIFKGANKYADKISQTISNWERAQDKPGKSERVVRVAGSIVRTLFPILKVPANLIGRSIDMTGYGVLRGAKMHWDAVRSGEAMTPQQADNIIKAYKYGSVGLVAAYLAFAQPSWFQTGGFYVEGAKNRLDDEGKPIPFNGVRVNGHDLPSWASHNSLFEAVQILTTIKRGFEQGRGDALERGGEVMKQTVGGLGLEAPGMEGVESALKVGTGQRDAGQKAGAYVKGMLVPQVVQQAVRGKLPGQQVLPEFLRGDVDKDGNTVKRKSRGFRDEFYEGVPFLRTTVPPK